MKPAVAATIPGWSGHDRRSTADMPVVLSRRSIAATRSTRPQSPRRRSASRRRRPSGCARASRWRAAPRSDPARSDPIRIATRARRRRCRRSRSADGSGVIASSCQPSRATAVRRPDGSSGRGASAKAVPIATRNDRRASGSALVWSRIRPSKPNAAALRITEPTLAGLSTASSTTRRVGLGGEFGDARTGWPFGTGPRSGAGSRARSRARRTSMPPP